MQGEAAVQQTEEARPRLIAPVWHTVLVVLIFLGLLIYETLSTSPKFTHLQPGDRVFLFIILIQIQWIVAIVVYAGMPLRETAIGQVVGRSWKTFEDFVRDCGFGLGFGLISILLTVVLILLFGPLGKPMPRVGPADGVQLIVFLISMVTAGVTEEFIFRGYLQRQVEALTGSWAIAVAAQAILFSLIHGLDQYASGYLEKFLFAVLMSVLARSRKSLLPAMAAHTFIDCLAAIWLYELR